MTRPLYFDGQTAGSRVVNVEWDHEALIITDIDQQIRWTWDEVREMRDQADDQEVVFNRSDDSEARLIIFDAEAIEVIRSKTPNRHRIVVPKGTARRLMIWTTAAIGSVLLIVFVIIPSLANVLTAIVPVEREVAMGNASMRQVERTLLRGVGEGFCVGEGGTQALDKMAARLTEEFDSPYEYRIRVFDSEVANAFAIPGGHIVFFDGLIQDAESPEMIAGVLAHEIGHVENRDSLRLLLRTAGSAGILSMLVGDFAGGALVLVVTEQLVNASHSQRVETNADIFATDRLAEAGLPSTPFGDFFDVMAEKSGIGDGVGAELLSYISTHPDLPGRADDARAANTVIGDYVPSLNEEEWAALRNICDDVDVKEDKDEDEAAKKIE
ncbi:MAG: M48 family metallopeptidase [Pseudomonadota bacterium]